MRLCSKKLCEPIYIFPITSVRWDHIATVTLDASDNSCYSGLVIFCGDSWLVIPIVDWVQDLVMPLNLRNTRSLRIFPGKVSKLRCATGYCDLHSLYLFLLCFPGILSGGITAPAAWIPSVASSLDTSQFDKEFTTMLPIGMHSCKKFYLISNLCSISGCPGYVFRILGSKGVWGVYIRGWFCGENDGWKRHE